MASTGATCFVSLDGTDFSINEPGSMDPIWYSHKFKCAGVRYEIGLCIKTGKIVWANGAYPCGSWPDIKIARDSYLYRIDASEYTLADKGYSGDINFITPNDTNGKRHKQIMARHETVNKRMKQFNVLKKKFHHDVVKHPRCFYSILNITE